MKNVFFAILLLSGLVNANLLRHNEQGLSPTQSYKGFAADENISNTNGNLVIQTEPARIDRLGLGIRLTRNFNSHWRDPLHTHQYDYDFDKADSRDGDGNPKIGLKDNEEGDANLVDSINPFLQRTRYQMERTPNAALGYYYGASVMYNVASTGRRTYNDIIRDSQKETDVPTGMQDWTGAGLQAAGLGLQLYGILEYEGKVDGDYVAKQVFDASLSAYCLVNAFNPDLLSNNLKRTVSTVAALYSIYQNAEYLSSSKDWDPGVEALRAAALANIAGGMALVLGNYGLVAVNPWLGVGLLVANLAAQTYAMYEVSNMHEDLGEFALLPWSLAVNGYVGMVGNKYQGDLSGLARKFHGYAGVRRVDEFDTAGAKIGEHYMGVSGRSMHPMAEMFLIRGDGGADRFVLNHTDSVERNNTRWYAYTALSRGVRTEVLYCDVYPYEGEGGRTIEGHDSIPKYNANDPNDYYLVREPDGTFARFGIGNLKGLVYEETKWDDPYELFWAMPDRVWNFAGDTVKVAYDGQLNITEVTHSADPRSVKIRRNGNTEFVETWDGNRLLFSVEQEFATHRFYDGKVDKGYSDKMIYGVTVSTLTDPTPSHVRMLVREAVPDGMGGSLETRYAYRDGNLSRRDLPDGSYTEYDFNPASRGYLDGFCQTRRQFGITDGAVRETRYTYLGWGDNKRKDGSKPEDKQIPFLETIVNTTLNSPSSTSGIKLEGKTDYYRFQMAMDGRNVRRNNAFKFQGTLSDTSVLREMEYRTARTQMMTQVLGSDGKGKRTDYSYDGDRLVGSVEYASGEAKGLPVITTYSYDPYGNQVLARVNPSDLLAKYAAVTGLTPTGAQLDSATLASAIESSVARRYPLGGHVLEKYKVYTYQNETNALYYNDSVVVLKAADGTDSVETRIARLNPAFDPFARYIAGAKNGEYELNLHPDSTALRSWFGGSFVVRDSLYLRPKREFVYAAGEIRPARDWQYSAANPYFATRERLFVDQKKSGQGWRARVTERDPDAKYGNYPAKVRSCLEEQSVGADYAWNAISGECPESSYEYSWRGQPVSETDPLNQTTWRAYDTLGRESWVKWPDGAKRTWNWHDRLGSDGEGKYVAETNESGLVTKRFFNGLGEPWKEGVYDAQGRDSSVTQSEYNVFGKLRWQRDADGRVTRRGYDSQGRLTSERRIGAGLKDYVRDYEWIDSTQTLVERDANGTATTFRYNLYGEDEEVRRQVDGSTVYVERHVYDNQGREVLSVAPDGDTTESVYGWTGKADSVFYPDRMSVRSVYNQLGEVERSVRAGEGSGLAYGAGADTLYWTLDGLGREVESGVRGDARSVRKTMWDVAGRLQKLELGSGLSEAYGYDKRSRVTRRAVSGTVDGVDVADTVTSAYRADGLRTGLGVRGAGYTWDYDGLGRVNSLKVKDPGGKEHAVLSNASYTKGGLPIGYTLAHDVNVAQEYAAGQPWLTSWVAKYDTTELQRMDYAYDREGNIMEMGRPGAGMSSYLYDGLYRLTAARYPTGGAADKAGTLTYGYTLNGNRTSFGHQFGSEGWQYYPGTNLAKSASGDVIGGRVYGFDYRGNRTREREYGSSAQAANLGSDWTRSRVAGFNNDGLLERYTVYSKSSTGGLDTSLYAYGRDVLGKKNFGATGKRDVSGDTTWSVKRRYTWDGDWVIADSTEVGRRYYAYLGHRRIAEIAEDSAGKWTARAVLTDHLGTVTGIVGDSGNVEAAYLLDPYGNLEHYAGKYQTLYLYTGKEWVSELAGYEFGARVYDPVMGMWWGRDPVLQYWSPYGSGNNPMNGLDPDGMFFDGSEEDVSMVYETCFDLCNNEEWDRFLTIEGSDVGYTIQRADLDNEMGLFSSRTATITINSSINDPMIYLYVFDHEALTHAYDYDKYLHGELDPNKWTPSILSEIRAWDRSSSFWANKGRNVMELYNYNPNAFNSLNQYRNSSDRAEFLLNAGYRDAGFVK